MQNIVLTLKTSDINLSDTQTDYYNTSVVTSAGSITNSKKTFTRIMKFVKIILINMINMKIIKIL